MAFNKRRKSLLKTLRDILISPFVFVFVVAWSNRIILCLTLVFMLFCMWMNKESLRDLIPNQETLVITLLSFGFISFAAVPLALRDYFSDSRYELLWIPTDGASEAGERIAQQLLAGDIQQLYSSFSPELKSRLSDKQFAAWLSSVFELGGAPDSIVVVFEKTINPEYFTDSKYDATIDCCLDVFLQKSASIFYLLSLQLKSTREFEIASLTLKYVPGSCLSNLAKN